MTRLLRGLRTPAKSRHRAPGRGRHRAGPQPLSLARRPERTSHLSTGRRAGYAATGLLVVAGTVAAAPVPERVRPAEAVTMRPPAVRPSARVVPLRRSQPVRRAAPRRQVYRWVVHTVPGRVLHGRATWYGPGFAGRRTASGEVFRPHAALTAAHRTLSFGTRLRVCRASRCVVVRINDRGPFGNAMLDLSWLAASRIGLERAGIGHVTATVLEQRRVRVAA